jgi:hypothetical protein
MNGASALRWDVVGSLALAMAGVVWLALLLGQVCVPGCVGDVPCRSDCGVNSLWFPVAVLVVIAGAALATAALARKSAPDA